MDKSNYKPYSAKRWTEIPLPKVIEGETYKEFTPEEKEQNDRDIERIMRKYGVLGKNEKIKNGKVVKC